MNRDFDYFAMDTPRVKPRIVASAPAPSAPKQTGFIIDFSKRPRDVVAPRTPVGYYKPRGI